MKGFYKIKDATENLPTENLPVVEPEQKSPASIPTPTNSAIEDFKRSGDWHVLEAFGIKVNGNTFLIEGSDKEKSGNIGTAKDGVPVAHFYSSRMAPTFEKDKSYNLFTMLQYLKHRGDKQAALADIVRQGYGCDGTGIKTADEWHHTDLKKTYLVNGVMVSKLNLFFGGEEKTLKTSIATDLVASVATGTPFLGAFVVPRKEGVMMLSGESGIQTNIETFDRVCRARELDSSMITNAWFSTWTPRFDNAENIHRIARDFRIHKPAVLIVDPLYYCVPSGIDGSITGVGETTKAIVELCQEHGVSLVLLHHLRKRPKGDKTYGPKLLSDLAGAGWGAMARQWLIITRRQAFIPGTGRHRLLIDIGASAGHSSRWAVDVDEGTDCENRQWEVTVTTAEEAEENKKELSFSLATTKARHKILDALKKLPDGETQKCILDVAHINCSDSSQLALVELINEGLVAKCKVTKNRTEYDGYKLKVAQ